MNKQYFNVTKLNDSVGEIDIYGEIVDETLSENQTSAISFKDALKGLKDVKDINVNVNSGGGDVFTGVAIHNMLKSHKANITVKIDGLAASIASVIAVAGDRVIMPANAMLMIHNAWSIGMGNANDLRKQANDLEKINNVVLQSYLDKNPELSDEYLQGLMDEETWLSAQEAYELGLVDEIAVSNRAAANITKNQIERYDNVPNRYRNDVDPNQPQPKKQPETNEEVTVDDVMAKLDEILQAVHELKSEEKKPSTEEDPKGPNNSFAKLFNL